MVANANAILRTHRQRIHLLRLGRRAGIRRFRTACLFSRMGVGFRNHDSDYVFVLFVVNVRFFRTF